MFSGSFSRALRLSTRAVGDVVDNFCKPCRSPLLASASALWRFFDQAVVGAAKGVDYVRLSSVFSDGQSQGEDYPLNLLMSLWISW